MKKMDAAFCATGVSEGVSSGMTVGRLNRLTRDMIDRRRKKSLKPSLNLVIIGSPAN